MYINDNNKKTYQSIILLNELVNGDHKFQTVANGDDKVLETLFIELMAKGYVQTSGMYYAITAKGQEVYDNFMQRYSEYLKVYDVFSFVDLEKGEFAFARYFDFDSDAQWDSFKNDERFDDLRIAVAMFKKVDPAEIVFMSFINENRFDTTSAGWQMDLASNDTWKEIEAICATAIKPEEVGEDAMVDMIKQGSELMINLLQEEIKQREQDNNNQSGGDTVVYETVEYYQPYYDPWYVSPIWLVPLFLW
jgi:predicted transcriptional regulator